MDKREENRAKALKDLQQLGVLMLDGHFDYGNGYHGAAYLNPHQLFLHPSTIWRFAQDLLDLLPGEVLQNTDVVAGPATGGALLAHTLAGLLDSRRSLTHQAPSLHTLQVCSWLSISSRASRSTRSRCRASPMAPERQLAEVSWR